MISVVIPTYNAEATLGHTLTALVPAVVGGIVQEAILVDGGSTDETCAIADAAGTRLIRSKLGRGTQLRAGAAAARGDWLLFLHADTVLEPGWAEEAEAFMERVAKGRRAPAAAAFRFALDDDGMMPRLLESLVALRCFLLRFRTAIKDCSSRAGFMASLAASGRFRSWRTSISCAGSSGASS